MTWYLAEGATHSGFNLFYLIHNPNLDSTTVQVDYLLPGGAAPIVRHYTVAGQRRLTIWVNQEGGFLVATDVSAVIRSTETGRPIIVERAMYLSRGTEVFAGHSSAGIAAPATSWYLAEGATGPFFDEFILVGNPSTTAADLQVEYLAPAGPAAIKTYRVLPMSRMNIWVNQEDPALTDTAVSARITSTNAVPVVVERAMWWPHGGDWHEAHASAGAPTSGAQWALAEGETGGPASVSTYLLVANVSGTTAIVQVTLVFEDGGTSQKTYEIFAGSRLTIAVRGEFPSAENRRFGAVVESLGATPAQIVVERAMYSDSSGRTWAAGTGAVATRLR